ncbi:MAG: hypothetical protein DCF15_18165 [Phormidesmis priestleyi]|uniref:Uncharacterized protein n=1 Tax=Phormidesmis priestleyi TaxID=268141 RepID=A0A2W4YPK7_9CYAN|nr:MAG: hypothetical protein DCF15_18165 [Phormidesmis priestleyi]
MADLLDVVIDLTTAGLELAPSELEARSLSLADELRAGRLADSAELARAEDLPENWPEGAKAGLLPFVGGIVKAKISRGNLKKTVDFLGNQFYGKTLTLVYKANGLERTIEYRNLADLELALKGIEHLDRLEAIRMQVRSRQTE